MQQAIEVALEYEGGSGPVYYAPKYYVSDHLGSVRAVVDSYDGRVVEARDYYPFGLQMPGRVYVEHWAETREGYTGHELDQETGMYYAGARYYMPALGRWTSVDPLADHPNQVALSTYNYAWNNPASLSDPDGRCPSCAAGAVIGATIDLIIQVTVEGRSFSEVDGRRILLSAGAGALSGGISHLSKIGHLTKVQAVTSEVLTDMTASAVSQHLETGEVDGATAVLDATVGQVMNRSLGDELSRMQASRQRTLDRAADRAERVASTDRNRAGRQQRRDQQAQQARSAADAYTMYSSGTSVAITTGLTRQVQHVLGQWFGGRDGEVEATPETKYDE